MMERQIVVVSTGGNEGLNMLRGIRAAGVFGTLTDAACPEIPREAKGAVIIGEAGEEAEGALRVLIDSGLPVLAFGAPAAQLCVLLGGCVTGHAVDHQLMDVRFANFGVCAGVEGGMRMMECAEYLKLPQGFRTLSMAEGVALGFDDGEGKRMGFQFLPEAQDIESSEIIGNFLWNVCGASASYTAEAYVERAVEVIREKVGDGRAMCVLTGGVDSTTAACLAKRAVGDRLHCLVIDTGLCRPGQIDSILEQLGEGLGLDIRLVQAQGRMMEQLRTCISPKEKDEAVTQFISRRIAEEVERLGEDTIVVQSVNYMDVLRVESTADVLTEGVRTVRPLEMLFKDEVRELAKALGVPEEVTKRQHYPSTGTALRCLGVVDVFKLDALRQADDILLETLEEAGQRKNNTQAFAVLADVSDLFGGAEKRHVVILRAVTGGKNGSRANLQRLPQDVLERAAERIKNEVPNVYKVVLDLTSGAVEWE